MNRSAGQNRELPLALGAENGEILLYINYCTDDGVAVEFVEHGCDRATIGFAGDAAHEGGGTGQMKRQTGDGMGISDQSADTASGTAGGRHCGASTQ